MHLGIAVTVGHVDFALWRQRGVRAAVKRLTAHISGRFPRNAELQQYLAVERAFAHEMPAVVGQIDRIVRSHMDAVRPRVLALAPRPQEISPSVEHDDRVLATVEDIDVIVVVDPDRSDLLERPPLGELRPILDDAVFEIAGADNDRHFQASANVPRATLSKRPALNNPPTEALPYSIEYSGNLERSDRRR